MRGAIVLAGGKSARMQHSDKAIIKLGNKAMISLVIDPLKQVVDEVVVVAASREQGERLKPCIGDARLAYDRITEYGPLSGILSGLEALHVESELAFVAACDMPFINPDVVKIMFKQAQGFDAIIPRWENGRLETLHAIYRREAMIIAANKAIKRGDRIILSAAFALPKIRYISLEEIKKIDPGLKTLINVNTPGDLEKLAINIKE